MITSQVRNVKNVVVAIIMGIVLTVVSVMPLNTVEVPSETWVIKPLPADWNPYQKLYDELLTPTVRIYSGSGIGSGVIINTPLTPLTRGDIHVLTAAHVVGNNSSVTVTLYSYLNNKQSVLCELCGSVAITDTNKDLALIRIPPTPLIKGGLRGDTLIKGGTKGGIYSAKLAQKDYKPFIFTPVWVVGCSLGLAPRPSFGHLTVVSSEERVTSSEAKSPHPSLLTTRYWEVSAPILPGNSGGGVFDANTHALIGIAVWVRTYQGQLITTMAGVVPIQTIYEFLDQVESREKRVERRPG